MIFRDANAIVSVACAGFLDQDRPFERNVETHSQAWELFVDVVAVV